MSKNTLKFSVLLIALVLLILPSVSLLSQDQSSLIDDFENDDVDDRWWSYDDGSTFSCSRADGGYNSDHALAIAFSTSPDSYPGCGIDIAEANLGTSSGLRFMWYSDTPTLDVTVVVNVVDPTQTNPDAEGATPFEAFLQTFSETWTEVSLSWEDFVKAEWVGESGVHTFDPPQAIELAFVIGDSQEGTIWIDDLVLLSAGLSQASNGEFDKFSLWTNGTQLRGINTWQRIVVPELDGDEFLGADRVGPPYIQEDFDRLAGLGANYVNISGPGLFTEVPPYVLDEAVQANLDNLLAMIEQADMFAVISFRTGPGRSDFTFYRDGAGVWFDENYLVENVWEDQAAQDAWATMWHYTADRYRNNPIVVGYDLMVEPNSAGIFFEAYEPEEFHPQYDGTLYDWKQLYPRIVAAIREVDADTPILIGGNGWSGVAWLPYLEPVDDDRVVYMVHQYEPQDDYTHQEPPATISYPGTLDLDYDGVSDPFDRAWLDGFLTTIDDFKAEHGVPVGVNEYGVVRWIPGGAAFMRDSMALFEARGMNHALWMWNPAWPPHQAENDHFDFMHGPDPNNHSAVADSDLIQVIRQNWSQNTLRPSTVRQ